MGKINKTEKRRISRILSGRHLFAVLISVFIIAGVIAAYRLITIERDYSTAKNEYDELREFSPARMASPDWIESQPDFSGPEQDFIVEAGQEQDDHNMPDLSEINRDYIGWIHIEGTVIDYPVVQGFDNIKYLSTTFRSERSSSGTIFMDAGCPGDFSGFSILHGHNMRNGSMFADLNTFPELPAPYPDISIFTKDGRLLTFTIFDVKKVDQSDKVFTLAGRNLNDAAAYFSGYGFTSQDFIDGTNILVLATCTNGHRDERLVVFAVNHGV